MPTVGISVVQLNWPPLPVTATPFIASNVPAMFKLKLRLPMVPAPVVIAAPLLEADSVNVEEPLVAII